MTTKVKGLFKGLRYTISHNIFDEKEPEFEIGLPTDVKHVAHIGADGPSSTTPSWMNEFKSSPESMSGPLNSTDDLKSLPSPKAQSEAGGSTNKSKHKSRRSSSDAPKHSRRPSNASSAASSPASSPKAGDVERKSRRHRSSNTMGSPARESSGGGSVKSRKSKKSSSNQGDVSPTGAADQPSIPKHSRTRKSRARSKDQPGENSSAADGLPPTADGGSTKSNTAGHLTSVLDAYQDER
ncbi:unnamed protein product [Linum trigynum]|uniref:CRIB domain-containing protein n=1 Tax=Linum trigynum TaxID=586398 RepID=A0AAV2GLA8_9ROSI